MGPVKPSGSKPLRGAAGTQTHEEFLRSLRFHGYKPERRQKVDGAAAAQPPNKSAGAPKRGKNFDVKLGVNRNQVLHLQNHMD